MDAERALRRRNRSECRSLSTPILIGLDMLRYYGLVLDYANDTVYSHRLKRSIPSTVLKSGHLAISMLPEADNY